MGKRGSRDSAGQPVGLESRARPLSRLAKLSIPKLPGALLRERPLALLDEQFAHPLVWIHGPPGAGKTTLACTFLERSTRTVLWYRADAGDSDLPSVFYHLREAALSVRQAASALPLLSPEYLLDVATFSRNYFRTLFALFDDPAVLVVDNYQDAGEGILDSVINAAVAELPNHINLLVLSRSAPPAAFAAQQVRNVLATIDWEDLQLTVEEARAIAAKAHIEDADLVRALHADCDGWVAGLVLLLENAKQVSAPRLQVMARARDTLFSYFSSELFSAVPPAIQRLMLCTALLPSFTASQAAMFASMAEVEQVLEWLYERNFFMECRGRERTYHYHALFREFLLHRAQGFFSAEQRRALLLQSVGVFENDGQSETALLLAIQATAWEDAARLTCSLAPQLLRQGRYAVLDRWITALPQPVLNQSPWLRYWLGVARLPFDPGGSRTILQGAHGQFEQQGETLACLLATSGILQSFFLEWGDQHPIDAWLEVFRALIRRPDIAWPQEVEILALPCLAATILRHAGDPLLEWGADRANALAYATVDPEQLVTLAFFVAVHCQMMGQWQRGAALLQHLGEVLAKSSVPPLQSLQWSVLKITWYTMCSSTCSQSGGRAEVDRFIELSQSSGIRVLDAYGLSQGIYFALNWRDTGMASKLLERMRASLAPHRIMDAAHFYWLQTAVAMESGDLDGANESMRISMERAAACGTRFGLAQNNLLLAQLQQLQGDSQRALQTIEKTLGYARAASSLTFEHSGLLVKAYILLNSNQEQDGLAALREGLALARSTGQSVIAPSAMSWISSYLYSAALVHNIEVGHVRMLIRAFNIQPAQRDVANWPWPIRIQVLGRFTVSCNDEPIRFASKTQKKPLELLRTLIALGSHAVNIENIITEVWPGDPAAARASFDVALMRLRKLLRHPDVLELMDGKLTLNDQLCWVDCWAFERAVARLDDRPSGNANAGGDAAGAGAGATGADSGAIGDGANGGGGVLDLYRGAFVEHERGTPATVNMRDRLAAKFQRTVLHFGKLQEQARRWAAAAHIYQRALEQDNLHEEFYRRLMTCQCHLGQHAEAIKTYRRCSRSLSLNFGLKPHPETEAVYRRALTA
jgi:LuxR family maltose regulon positive regulatory protein